MRPTNVSLTLAFMLGLSASVSAQTPVLRPVTPQVRSAPEPAPISASERLRWTLKSTVGTGSLVTGVFSSAWATATNSPEEYGPHYGGFGKRYGMRLTGIATSSSIEAGLGSIWEEDPRYFSSSKDRLLEKVKYAGRMTFFARRANGTISPAYARFIAVPTSNFISNSWRVESESSVSSALVRTGLGFVGRFAGNVIHELWGDGPGR